MMVVGTLAGRLKTNTHRFRSQTRGRAGNGRYDRKGLPAVHDPDLTDLLASWPHEPGRVNARLVRGLDGRTKIQVRVELGILQLEAEGRPDGARPGGFESLLHAIRARMAQLDPEGTGVLSNFRLSPEECAGLREEAVQYYHRYISLFALEDFEGVVRDTSRNLEVFDLCRRYASTEQDREVLEQFRPFVLMMRTRAEAACALRAGHTRGAVAAIDRGIDALRTAFASRGQLDRFDSANETQALRGLRDALIPKLPSSQRIELEERLRAAIAAENYELAAILRDELRQLS